MPAGLWAREVGRLVGLELPVLAMEHHYLVTEDLPEVAARSDELPHCIDFEAEIYTCARKARACWSAPTRRTAGPGPSAPRRPTSATSCWRPTSIASRPASRSPSQHFPALARGRHQAGDQRPVHLRAGRQSAGRAGAGPAQLLRRLRRHGRVLAGRRRRPDARQAGSSRAIRAWTCSRWTWRALATSRPGPTPTPRCGRTTAAASRSPFPTRSCRRRGRCARRRSTIG